MKNDEVIKLITNVFNKINNAKSVEDIFNINKNHPQLKMSSEYYPLIDF